MALDARHRSSLYQKFVPLLGDDDANALMSEFPALEADELVTKQFLRAELTVLDKRLTGQMTDLDKRLSGKMTDLDRRHIGHLRELEERLAARSGRHLGYIIATIGLATAFLRLT